MAKAKSATLEMMPEGLAKPARRALAQAGFTRLEQFTKVTEADVARLHGMGPRALRQIREALAANRISFAIATNKGRNSK
jgi:hypothetical protein